MKRGDVVRTWAEYIALPPGTQVIGINGVESTRGSSPPEAYSENESWLPALVRVVGRVEPEWLEAAARHARAADVGRDDWDRAGEANQREWRNIARAAVAAADKARGIVNSREEFDALPAGTVVHTGHGAWHRVGDFGKPYPVEWPCVVAR